MGVIFLTLLGSGFLGVLATCRMNEVGWKFVRLIAILAMAELALAVAGHLGTAGGRTTRAAMVASVLCGLSGLGAFIVMGLAPLARRYAIAVRASAGAGGIIAFAGAIAWLVDAGTLAWPMSGRDAGITVAAMSSSALLGSASLAMLLGHAYLTHTAMTIAPLRKLSALLLAAMGMRVGVATVGATLLCGAQAPLGGSASVATYTLPLIVRYGVGLLIPAVFCVMVWRTVQLRATQSATGILYFGLVLICLGELAALHLMRELGIAF